jgi:hypothetical protein
MELLGVDPVFATKNVSPVYGNPHFNRELHTYLLPSILSAYGPPARIVMTVWPDDPAYPQTTWHPFSLALVYPEQGIYVEYVMPRERLGEHYLGCPDKSKVSLAVWDPSSKLSLEEIVARAGLEISLSYGKPLEEVTSRTLDEFYEIFKDSGNTSCIETRVDLWPEP